MPENINIKNNAITYVECCVCGKRLGSKLVEKNDLYDRLLEKFGKVVSHTYCPDCAETLREEYKNYKAGKEASTAGLRPIFVETNRGQAQGPAPTI